MKKIVEDIKTFFTEKIHGFRTYLLTGLGLTILLLMVAFSESRYDAKKINKVDINIKSPFDHQFIKQKDVKYMIRDQFNLPLETKDQETVNLFELENTFESNPFVKNAEVYNELEGTLAIRIKQRNPVLRIINKNEKSFYLDEQGQKMPTSYQYTAPVLMASGEIQSSADQLDSVTNNTVKSLYRITRHVRRDTFLNALVGNIQVTPEQEFKLIPRAGKQTIILGKAKNLDQRFKKLKTFYRKVLPNKGWQKYKKINLQFKKQIVAKK